MNSAPVAAVIQLAPVSALLSLLSLLLTLYNIIVTRYYKSDYGPLTGRVSELVLVPANTALSHWYIWNVTTTSWLDDSLVKCLIFTAIFFLFATRLEAGLGHKGLVVYLLFVTTITGIMTSLFLLFIFLINGPDYFYTTKLVGQAGLVLAVLLGNVRVDNSDMILLHTNFFDSKRIKTHTTLLPGLFGYSVLGLLLPSGWIQDIVLAWFSFFVGFFLLKNFEFHTEEGAFLFVSRVVYADDEFSVEFFFPDQIRPFVHECNVLFYNLLLKLRNYLPVRDKRSRRFGINHLSRNDESRGNVNIAEKGYLDRSLFAEHKFIEKGESESTNLISERRRARALVALNQKLAEKGKISNKTQSAVDGKTPTKEKIKIDDGKQHNESPAPDSSELRESN